MSSSIDITTGGKDLGGVRGIIETALAMPMMEFDDEGDPFLEVIADGCRVQLERHSYGDDGDLHFSAYPFHVCIEGAGGGDLIAMGHRLFGAFKSANIPALLTDDFQVRIAEYP